MVGQSMSHLLKLKILSLGIGASETEIKVHYRQLAHKYHPDNNDCVATGLTMEEATEFFKLLNNVNDYLKKRAYMDSAPYSSWVYTWAHHLQPM